MSHLVLVSNLYNNYLLTRAKLCTSHLYRGPTEGRGSDQGMVTTICIWHALIFHSVVFFDIIIIK